MKTEKNRKLKGSVLLTVVSIMALLIVFLTSALVLATASNRRAHRDYSSSQAEYTARAAIDSAIASINQNENVRAAVQEINAPMYANVSLGNDSLGRLVRTDASGNDVFDQITLEPVLDSNGNIKQVYYYDNNGVTTAWHAYNQIKITATVKVGKERKTVSVYAATTPTSIVPGQTPSNIQGLQTAGGAGFTTTGGNITGAFNVGLMNSTRENYAVHNDTSLHEVENFINGNFESSGGGIYIDVMSPASKTTILGDLVLDNHGKIVINYTPTSAPVKQQDVPYLFVEGCLKRPASQALAMYVGATESDTGAHSPYNVFVGTLDAGQLYLSGDLYIMDEDGTNYMGNDWACKLYDWTDNMAGSGGQFSSSGGNIYCRGDMNVDGGVSINGDFRVAKTLVIDGTRHQDFDITGRVIADAVIIRNDGDNKIHGFDVYCNNYSVEAGADAGNGPVTSAFSAHGINFHPLSDSGITADQIYPSSMTKEEIYGHATGGDSWSISSDPTAPNYSPNKIIKNIVELRKALNYDATNGVFDENVYINRLGSNVISAIADDSAHPVKWSTLSYPVNINNTSCQSAFDQNVLVIDKNVDREVHITIDANDSIVIVLEDGITISKPLIIDAPDNKEATLFVNGLVTVDQEGCIVTKKLYDRVAVNNVKEIYEWDSINITIYANKTNSAIRFRNGGLVTANAMAPTMALQGYSSDPSTPAFKGVKYFEGASAPGTMYTDVSGNSTFKPNWIGNAFVRGIEPIHESWGDVLPNNFTLLYTRNGNNGGNPPPGGQNTVPMYYERFFAEY